MTPFHSDAHLTVYIGDCRTVMAELEAESIDCVITSPPYFSLRDYGIPPTVWGGDAEHEHLWTDRALRQSGGVYLGKTRWQHNENGRGEDQPGERRQKLEPFRIGGHPEIPAGSFCECGAWYGCLGLEPTPRLYLEHIVEVFQAVRRVLRKDGTCWLNIGDSYSGDKSHVGEGLPQLGSRYRGGGLKAAATAKPERGRSGLKAKDRMMMPARVAIALQEDGWWLRDEIVWAKPNPMPSSVQDRTTPAHEMVYLLTRSARYRYDAEAIRERGATTREELLQFGERTDVGLPAGRTDDRRRLKVPGGWDVTQGSGGHGTVHRHGRTAATYHELKLDQNEHLHENLGNGAAKDVLGRNKRSVWTVATAPYPEAHFATFPPKLIEPMILAGCPVGGVVLDPFGGSGTVGLVAESLGRRSVLIDLSPKYAAQMLDRVAEGRRDGTGAAADLPIPAPSDSLWAGIG